MTAAASRSTIASCVGAPTPSGGGWAGIAGDGEAKGLIDKFELQIWIR